jgi:hypothetical protein
MIKECYKCKTSKSITDFHKSKSKKDGLDSKCKSCVLEYSKKYYKENTETRKQTIKNWEENNIERKKLLRKSYSERNKDKEKYYSYHYFKERYNNDIKFKIFHAHRTRIHSSIKNKSNSSKELLGCTIKEYYEYIENQFDNNMTWDNYGTYWEIDHIIPINTFDLNLKEQCIKAFNYKNTRPLSCHKNKSRPRNGRDLFGEAK